MNDLSKKHLSETGRAVHIAAVVMQTAGLCRYENPGRSCRRATCPTEDDCVKCIEKWLLAKARQELRREEARP